MKKLNFTRKVGLLSLTFFLSTQIFAQVEKFSLSLQDAVKVAMENNKSLKINRADIDAKDEAINEAIAQGLPQVSSGLDYMTYFGYEMAFNFGDGTEVDQELIDAAMAQTLEKYPTWDYMGYAMDQEFEATVQEMMPASTIEMSDQLTGNIQVGQLLFSGQYIIGLQTAKLVKVLAEQSYTSAEFDVKQSVHSSYYLVLMSEESLKVIEQNVSNLRDIFTKTKAMVAAGIAEQTDLDQISIQLSMLENTRRSMERTVKLNYNMLRFQLGTTPDAEITLTETINDIILEGTMLSNSDLDFNIEKNVNYQLAASNTELKGKMVGLEKWAYAPTVTGFYSYNAKIITTSFDMNPNHAAGASLALPIFDGGSKRAKVAQAKIELDKARITQSMLIDQLHLQEKQLKFELDNSIENYKSQKENIEVAKRVFQSFKRKYEQGMASSLELTQANTNYLHSETNFIQAEMTLLQAKLELNKLLNNL